MTHCPVAFSPDATTLTPELEAVLNQHDHALFLARLGDQLRFKAMPTKTRPIVSYALDQAAFASAFGTAPYPAFVALKQAINTCLGKAVHIRVTCPLGTDFSARQRLWKPSNRPMFPSSASRCRFCTHARGELSRTGRRCPSDLRYRLAILRAVRLPVHTPLAATIEAGRIIRWEGEPSEVERVEAHYRDVSARYGIDAEFVHSWHAGFHPGCAYPGSAHDNYERWSGSAFGNPRLLHFHTCGAYAPGEICWNVVDPTIEVDGRNLWDHGRLCLETLPGTAAIVAEYPEIAALFAAPDRRIGLGM